MSDVIARVVSVHVGEEGELHKESQGCIELALDGIVGDRHRGLSRQACKGDKQAAGTERRNERQWSAVSQDELLAMTEALELRAPLQASDLGANLNLGGVAKLSRLPRGTTLTFSSGAVLMVEEYNPPCSDMSEALARRYTTRAGERLSAAAFSSAAKYCRGIVGVIEVAGSIAVGDRVNVAPESLPKWLR